MLIVSPSSNEELKKSLNLPQIKKIKDLFIMIISELNQNLKLKSKLFSIQGFFPDILFLKLDYFSKKNISTQDILHYLKQHNYKFNDEIIRRFIKQYDKHGNYNLIYDDFLKIISPLDNNINTNINNDSKIIDEIFCEILINELKLIGFIGEMALQIRSDNIFDNQNIFMEITKNNNYLDKVLLTNFLEGNYNEKEINQLIYYLDSNNDGIISYDDFHDLLLPIKSDFEIDENNNEYNLNNNIDTNKNNYIINDNIMSYNYCDNKSNEYYNYLLNNKNIYSMNRDINTDSNEININHLNINYDNNSNEKNNDNILEMKEIQEKNEEEINLNNPMIDNTCNKEKQRLYNKYLYNYEDIKDEQNENNDDYKNNTTLDFYPKILNEEKAELPDIKENTFTKRNFLNNNQDFNLNNNNYYNIYYPDNSNIEFNNNNLKNIVSNKEDDLKINNENDDIIYNDYSQNKYIQQDSIVQKKINENPENNIINNNILLQKFPMTFGLNQENNIHEQNYTNDINNNDINNNINNNNKIFNMRENDNNYKDEIKYYINKYLYNDSYDNFINNQTNNEKSKTFNNKSNINMELFNNNHISDLIPSKTYSYPIKGKENINIINNLDIKSNINHHHKKKSKNKNKKCPNIPEAINIFFEYINIIIMNENRIEHIKENLTKREDLSLKEIFNLFDKDQTNFISLNNFQLICKKIFNLYPTLDQVKLVFKRYKKIEEVKVNSKNDFSLNFEEFIKMMSPQKTEYINIIDNKNKIDKTNIKLSVKSKNILTELIKCLIQKETDYYKIRNKLNESCLELLWKEIIKHSKNKDKISKKQMNKFLEKYGYFLEQKQIDNIFFIFDKEYTGKIKEKDFIQEMCSD